jgi:hypothetical protein
MPNTTPRTPKSAPDSYHALTTAQRVAWLLKALQRTSEELHVLDHELERHGIDALRLMQQIYGLGGVPVNEHGAH